MGILSQVGKINNIKDEKIVGIIIDNLLDILQITNETFRFY